MLLLTQQLKKNPSWELNNQIWQIAIDFNRKHEETDGEEIFMCEHVNDDTGEVDGFYIEDDYFITHSD